jgi:Flp pilus assembly protein TadG
MIAYSKFSSIHDERGSAIVEAAFAVPIFLMFVLGSLFYTLTLWEVLTLEYAVQLSARCEILPQPTVGEKQCGTYQTYGERNAYGMSLVDNNFSKDFTTIVTPYQAACVTVTAPNFFTSLNVTVTERKTVTDPSIYTTLHKAASLAQLSARFCRPELH